MVSEPQGGIISSWLADAGYRRATKLAEASVLVFSPELRCDDLLAQAEALALPRVACLPVIRDDHFFAADEGEAFVNLRADAYASCHETLRAALSFVLREDRSARGRGALRVTWLGPLGQLNLSEPQIGSSFPLEAERRMLVGRSSRADIVVRQGAHSDQCSVARQHAVFERTRDGLVVRDLRSTNGTWVKGRAVEQALIGPGDEVAISAMLRLRIDGAVEGVQPGRPPPS